MMELIQEYVTELREIIDELETYVEYYNQVKKLLDKIELDYQAKRFGYFEYVEILNKALKGKTKKEVLETYQFSILGLLRRAAYLDSKIFFYFYEEKPTLIIEQALEAAGIGPELSSFQYVDSAGNLHELRTRGIAEARAKVKQMGFDPKVVVPITFRYLMKLKDGEKIMEAPNLLEAQKIAEARYPGKVLSVSLLGAVPTELEEKVRRMAAKAKAAESRAPLARAAKPEEAVIAEIPKETLTSKVKPRERKEIIFGDQPKHRPVEEEPPRPEVRLPSLEPSGGMFSNFAKAFKSRMKPGPKGFISDKTTVLPTVIGLKGAKEAMLTETRISPTLLAQEAKRLRAIITKSHKVKVYTPSSLGSLANILVRPISLYFIERFPDMFRTLYNALRLANIKILSNTYVNIMFLMSFVVFLFSWPMLTLYYYYQGQPLFLFLAKGFIMGSLLGFVTFLGMYAYPFMVAKSRRTNINSNLPFAINHMSAVISAGVPPDEMFRLIAESDEYKEIAVECSKIVEYTDVFGYDIISAVKSVALLSPSPAFKEFLEGMTSTIESGGDLKHYLTQKSSEAMLTYKLERQKYLEAIATYSDIYTGILIAAPLFFVAALSLVSILGGTIGGFEVSFLITLGTYFVIPLLNVAFIMFLEMTQPEI